MSGPAPNRTQRLPEKIGRYAIRRHLGSGAMGVVYLAEQEKPRRQVAIKVMKGWALGADTARRFELEAELLGRLQHRGIAQIFESGTEGSGPLAKAFLAMEYIDGRTLTDYAEEESLDQDARVRLLIDIAKAVHHAHVRGVVHRDLKPSNILVTQDGHPKIIDFGIARDTERGDGATVHTETGDVVGTLNYMSPEQVQGDIDAIDTRTDVYALGVLAFQLLSGRLPLTLSSHSITEAAWIVCEEDPPRLGGLVESCRGDLEWIVARALEKESSRRYQSAASFATDLERSLNHDPIEARPATAIYQLRKIVRRHRALLSGALIALLTATAAVAFGGYRINEKNHELEAANRDLIAQRKRCEESATEASAINEFLNRDLLATVASSNAEGDRRHVSMREVLDTAAVRIEEAAAPGGRFADRPLVEAGIRAALGNTYLAIDIEAAQPHLERGLALMREHRGNDREPTIEMMSALSVLRNVQRRHEEAEALSKEALKHSSVLWGPEHPRTIDAIHGLATVYRTAERFEEAERLGLEVVAQARKTSTKDSDRLARWFGGLASTYLAQNRLADAEILLREALSLEGQAEGSSLTVGQRLGVVLFRQRKYREALAVFKDVQAKILEITGPTHQYSTICTQWLAKAYEATGKYERAEAAFLKAIDLARESTSPGVASGPKNDYGMFLGNRGRFQEAVEPFREALEEAKAAFGPANKEALVTATNLAIVYHQLGRPEDAVDIAEWSFHEAEEHLGEEHPRTLTAMGAFAKVLLWAKNLDDAFEYAELLMELTSPDDPALRDRASLLSEIEGAITGGTR